MPVSRPTVGAVARLRSAVVLRLRQSKLFREYQQAFEAATGLPLVLREAGSFRTPLEGSKRANPFCTLLTQTNKTCAACLEFQQRAEQEATLGAKTLQCYAGLSESAVPVRLGDHVLAYLQTGQVFLRTPAKNRFKDLSDLVYGPETGANARKLEAAYLKTRVLTKPQYRPIIRLLAVFAEHLATVCNQMLVGEATAESAVITKARTFIAEHQGEALRLGDVARAANISVFYFCKVFKKTTGFTFTEYLARGRIETVKQMLLNAQTRIGEAAYAAGFQSLSQFNRVFHRVAGETPRRYRERLHGAAGKAARSGGFGRAA